MFSLNVESDDDKDSEVECIEGPSDVSDITPRVVFLGTGTEDRTHTPRERPAVSLKPPATTSERESLILREEPEGHKAIEPEEEVLLLKNGSRMKLQKYAMMPRERFPWVNSSNASLWMRKKGPCGKECP